MRPFLRFLLMMLLGYLTAAARFKSKIYFNPHSPWGDSGTYAVNSIFPFWKNQQLVDNAFPLYFYGKDYSTETLELYDDPMWSLLNIQGHLIGYYVYRDQLQATILDRKFLFSEDERKSIASNYYALAKARTLVDAGEYLWEMRREATRTNKKNINIPKDLEQYLTLTNNFLEVK
jgi:hypothetical protein